MPRHNGNTQPVRASGRRSRRGQYGGPPLSVEAIAADLGRSKPRRVIQETIVCPSGKTGYPTEAAALDAMASIQAKEADGTGRRAVPIRAYNDCQRHCGAWHLTADPAREPVILRRERWKPPT